MSRRALVTGGAGFIGSHVADALLEQGYSVDIIDNFSSGDRRNVPPAAKLHDMDITSSDAAQLIREARFDAICHLAAQIDVRKSVADPAFDASVNVGGTLNLIEAVRQSAHPTRFVFSSTGGAIYGDFVPVPTEEQAPKDPESPYGVAKLSAEYYLAYYARVHGLDTVALRYSNVYGPRQNPHGEAGVVAIFCTRILEGKPLTIFGEGTQTRDYVYAVDVAQANVAAVSRPLARPAQLDLRAYNVGTSRQTTVLDLANGLRRAAGSDVPVQHAPARTGEQQRSAIIVDKAAKELGWQPKVQLEEGLRLTYEFFAARHREKRA
ncbi:MAG TPA: NAD-dependent epimerase/dehydratase family protein [Gemmatimonadaceae bacterium]|jgi:UDP-glucose 4-epimerase